VDSVIVSADGTRLAVRRVGRGYPVVALHGSGGGLHSWAEIARRLGDGYEFWLVARRGYAPNDAPVGENSFARESADVRAVLAAVATATGGRAHLVGGSYGATLALHATRDLGPGHPLAPRTLCLYEPPLFAAGPHLVPVLAQYRKLLHADDLAGARLLFAEQVARVPPALLAALDAGGEPADRAAALRSAAGEAGDLAALARDTPDLGRWAAVDRPVLLTSGARTWPPMPATMEALAAVLPDVEPVVWPDQSHFATSTAPDLVAATMRDFLSRRC